MVDLWIIDKFNVLPTDKKFIDLFSEQKIALFEGVCSLPDQESLKKNVLISRKEEEIKSRDDSTFINPGLKSVMEKQYRESGFSEDKIKNKIQEIIDTKKQMELSELEKLKNG